MGKIMLKKTYIDFGPYFKTKPLGDWSKSTPQNAWFHRFNAFQYSRGTNSVHPTRSVLDSQTAQGWMSTTDETGVLKPITNLQAGMVYTSFGWFYPTASPTI